MFDQFHTREAAQAGADRVERAGYKAIVYKVSELDRIGLPVGWEAGLVDWDSDYTYCAKYVSEHRKAAYKTA